MTEGKKGGRGREKEGEEKVEEEKGDEERSKNEERRQRHRREKTGAQSCVGVPLHLQLLRRLNSPGRPESFQEQKLPELFSTPHFDLSYCGWVPTIHKETFPL